MFSSSVSGVQQADEAEMKLMASTPRHVYSVGNFNEIKSVQKEFISKVCASVDDQLSSLVSGEEGEIFFYIFCLLWTLLQFVNNQQDARAVWQQKYGGPQKLVSGRCKRKQFWSRPQSSQHV